MKLIVDEDYLIFAWQNDSSDKDYYLDTQTGSVVLIERDLEDLDDLRDEIELNSGRFLYIPKTSQSKLEMDLSDFVCTVGDPKLQNLLIVALDSASKISNCAALLARYPDELKRWQETQLAIARDHVRKWLAAHDIEI